MTRNRIFSRSLGPLTPSVGSVVVSAGVRYCWIAFHTADSAPLTLAQPAEIDFTDTHREIMATLENGGAYFFRQLGAATEFLTNLAAKGEKMIVSKGGYSIIDVKEGQNLNKKLATRVDFTQ